MRSELLGRTADDQHAALGELLAQVDDVHVDRAIEWRQAFTQHFLAKMLTRYHLAKMLRTLWTDTLAKNPAAWMAHNNLGLLLFGEGRTDEAMAHYRAAEKVSPGVSSIIDIGGQDTKAIQVDPAGIVESFQMNEGILGLMVAAM